MCSDQCNFVNTARVEILVCIWHSKEKALKVVKFGNLSTHDACSLQIHRKQNLQELTLYFLFQVDEYFQMKCQWRSFTSGLFYFIVIIIHF